MEEEKKEAVESNLMSQENATALIIETKDGKEYRIEKKLPTKAGNIFNMLMAKFLAKDDNVPTDELIDNNDKMMEMLAATIIAANRNKYPELTRDYILGTDDEEAQFDEFDMGAIYNMYADRWFKISTRRMKSRTVAPSTGEKKTAIEGA